MYTDAYKFIVKDIFMHYTFLIKVYIRKFFQRKALWHQIFSVCFNKYVSQC